MDNVKINKLIEILSRTVQVQGERIDSLSARVDTLGHMNKILLERIKKIEDSKTI